MGLEFRGKKSDAQNVAAWLYLHMCCLLLLFRWKTFLQVLIFSFLMEVLFT